MITKEDGHVSFDDTSIAFGSRSNGRLRKMNLLFSSMNNKTLVNAGTSLLQSALKFGLPIKGIIKKTIFEQFCGGETINDCQETIVELGKSRIGTILDYSVEGEENEKSFDATTAEIILTIEKAKGDKNLPFCVFKVTGLGAMDLLEKVQKSASLSNEEAAAYERVKIRVDRICRKSFENNVRTFIDAEDSWIQDTIDALANDMMEKYNKQTAIVYNTYQMYRADMLKNLKAAHQLAVEKAFFLGVKLVRGAYMEKERERAQKMGYPNPIQPDKEATDSDFNKGLLFCVENKEKIFICAGSHNEYSNYYLTAIMNKYGIEANDPHIYFAQLYGMSDNISYNLANAGYNVAKYVPYGPIESVMPYLFRRAQENTSMAGQTSRELGFIKKEIARRKAERR